MHGSVLATIGKIFAGGQPGKTVSTDLPYWYSELHRLFVQVGRLSAADLAGYRERPVFLKGASHVRNPVRGMAGGRTRTKLVSRRSPRAGDGSEFCPSIRFPRAQSGLPTLRLESMWAEDMQSGAGYHDRRSSLTNGCDGKPTVCSHTAFGSWHRNAPGTGNRKQMRCR